MVNRDAKVIQKKSLYDTYVKKIIKSHFSNKLFKSPLSGLCRRCSSLNNHLITYIYIYVYVNDFIKSSGGKCLTICCIWGFISHIRNGRLNSKLLFLYNYINKYMVYWTINKGSNKVCSKDLGYKSLRTFRLSSRTPHAFTISNALKN